jgi:hypothetical protein
LRLVIEDRFTIHQAAADDPRGHACEPRILRCADGTILLAFRTGTGRGTPDGSPRLLRSRDDGASWADLGTPFLGRPEAAGGDLRGCALAELPSGGLLAVIVWLDRTDPDRPIYHPATEGLTPVRNLIFQGDDDGESWAALGHLEIDVRQAASQGLLALPDGDILATFETFKAYDDPGRWVYRGGLVRSADGGRTWREPVFSAVMSDAGTMWWDPRIARLPDGSLLQLYYAYEHDQGGESPVHIGWSQDGGRTWTPPAPTSLTGQASFPIPFPGGELLAFTQRRDESQAMVGALSRDGGRTWGPQAEVYRHEAPSAPAAAPGQAPIDYLVSMDRFTFGHPCGVALDERRALLVWYAGGSERTAIHGAVVALDRAGGDA